MYVSDVTASIVVTQDDLKLEGPRYKELKIAQINDTSIASSLTFQKSDHMPRVCIDFRRIYEMASLKNFLVRPVALIILPRVLWRHAGHVRDDRLPCRYHIELRPSF